MGFFDRVGRFIDDVLLLPEDLRSELESAELSLEAGQSERAEQLFVGILEQRGSLSRAWVGLARAREMHQDLRGAREAVAQALELDPGDGTLAFAAARLSSHLGDHEQAASYARSATQTLGQDDRESLADAYGILASAEHRRGHLERAIREYRKALALRSAAESPSSVRPEDIELRVAMLEALCAARRTTEARAAVTALRGISALPDLRIGRALLNAGIDDLARESLMRATEHAPSEAHALLSDEALRRQDLDAAEHHARLAVASGGGLASLRTLGEVLLSQQKFEDAAEALAAASAERDLDLLRRAALAVPMTHGEDMKRYAERIAFLDEDDPVAKVVDAFAEWRLRDDAGATEARLDEIDAEVSESDGAYTARVALRCELLRAELAMSRGDFPKARRHVERVLEGCGDEAGPVSDLHAAEALRKRVLRSLWRTDSGGLDLPAAIDAVIEFAASLGATPHTDGDEASVSVDLERRAQALRDELDRPLLLAILGEFNAGKSTLINAFIGAQVAPMGIVPTTATLNMLRGGAKRRVRVVRKDGTTREGLHEDLGELLEQAEHEGVDRVEIILPRESLERVWVLDTPGTNALDPDHERLAREAIRRADAVLWVLDAAQAAKMTESKIYFGIRDSGRRVIPILNKRDRLKPGELDRVQNQVVEAFQLEDAPLSISGRQALRGQVNDDPAMVEASGFAELMDTLEQEVFSKADVLKWRACASRLLLVLDDMIQTEATALSQHRARAQSLVDLIDLIAQSGERAFRIVDDAIRWLERAQAQAFDEAAHEVLSFVRPRRTRFSKHGIHAEDRRFLFEIIERRFGESVEGCEMRLVDDLATLLMEIGGALDMDADELRARVRARVAPSLSALLGFQRGLLSGGALSRFFERVSTMELTSEAVQAGLLPARADLREELRPHLIATVQSLGHELELERGRTLRAVGLEQSRISQKVYAPLRALREVLAERVPNVSAN